MQCARNSAYFREATPTLPSEQNIYQESFPASVTDSAVVPTAEPTTVSLAPVAASASQAPSLSISTAVSTATPLTTSATPPVTQFASVLGGRVQIAPPLEVLAERQADSVKNDVNLRSESSNAPEVAERQLGLVSTPSRNIEIPELVRRFTSKVSSNRIELAHFELFHVYLHGAYTGCSFSESVFIRTHTGRDGSDVSHKFQNKRRFFTKT